MNSIPQFTNNLKLIDRFSAQLPASSFYIAGYVHASGEIDLTTILDTLDQIETLEDFSDTQKIAVQFHLFNLQLDKVNGYLNRLKRPRRIEDNHIPNKKVKLDDKHAEKCIEANKHDNVTTAYYLLLKKHIVNGGSLDLTQNYIGKEQKEKYPYIIHTPHPPKLELTKDSPIKLKSRRILKRKGFNKTYVLSVSPKFAPPKATLRLTGQTPIPGKHCPANIRMSPHHNRRRLRTSRLSMIY